MLTPMLQSRRVHGLKWLKNFWVQYFRSFASSSGHQVLIVKSNLPDIENCVGITLPEHLASFERPTWKMTTAFECGLTGAKISHHKVIQNAKSFSTALQQAGLTQRDAVSIILPNNIHYPAILLGIMSAGLIASPVNPAYRPEEMVRQIQHSESKCVITIPEFVPGLRNCQKICPEMKVIVVGDAVEGCNTYGEMIQTDPDEARPIAGSQIDTTEEIALLPYSSGTTGIPKGVCLTHFNMVSNLTQLMTPGCLTFSPTQDQDRFIGVLPFFHMYGLLTFILIGMKIGAHTICLPRFDPATYLKAVREHKPTILHLVTPLMGLLASSSDYGPKEFENVHTIVGAAAPIGSALIQKLLQKAGKSILFQEGYGLTETSPGVTVLGRDSKKAKVGSCGTLIPSTLGKILTTDDGPKRNLGPNTRGEICLKGPQVMKGYWKNEEATKEMIDSEGWLHTGDIGYYDEEGYFYIVDRLKELIKVKAFQVAPAELEALLCQHPMIAEAAVIGIPDEKSGELPRAYIVSKDPKLTAEDINSYLKDKVSYYKQLKGGIEFVENVPKAPSGKLLRRVLKIQYFEKHGIELP